MADLTAESDFFHTIAVRTLEFVSDAEDVSIAQDKGPGDFATVVDVAVEKMIVSEIRQRFPNDAVLAEEQHADTQIGKGRIWIIDPICGTGNLGKQINVFSTNIALAENGKLIASVVVDHTHKEYFWSVGDNKIFCGKYEYQPIRTPGTKIELDYGAVRKTSPENRQRHARYIQRMIEETDFELNSFNTSLSFAFVATGKMDGFINVFNFPWDICASSFLIQQTGGKITGLNGEAWTPTTVGAIAANTPELHQKLLDLFTQN